MPRAIVLAAAMIAAAWMPLRGWADPHRPYAGQETREIKALSAQQIADLRAGRGMGFALAAELNGYPGPVHVLEHAEALGLDPGQRERAQALHAAMKAEAVPLGERLIRQEAVLDRLFATGVARADTLEAATGAIAVTEAALRTAHLRYHLAMRDVLTPPQLRRYAELRGYSASARDHDGHAGHGR